MTAHPISPELLKELEAHFNALQKLERGDAQIQAREDSSVEIVSRMGGMINQLANMSRESIKLSMEMSLAIAQFLDVLNQMAAGNLKARAPIDFETEVLAALGKGINTAIAKVQERTLLEELLKELSTPVLYAWEGVIVMPLIGTLTSDRAQEAMEKLLKSITQHHARVALIDITGVPVIDSMVAQHLIRTIKAVKILGSDAIITGISAEVASILVKIGIEVEQFMTRSSLHEGLKQAIKMVGASQ
ncbi:MAG: STAS domain-containing protein [candidate division FCPU426 bacterium]